MKLCLPKFAADKLRTSLTSREITPEKLSQMTSDERRSVFTEIVGSENAKNVNAEFESKLILKNQQQGMVNWAKKVLGMNNSKLQDTLSKVNRMTEILQPADLNMFLDDLVEKRLGVDLSPNEAGKLVDLAQRAESAKSNISPDSPIGSKERTDYGTALTIFKDYVSELKTSGQKKTIIEQLRSPGELINNVAGTAKSILSSLDNSFFGRQGVKTLFTNPDIWTKDFIKSWGDFAKELFGIDATTPIKADVYSRPNALNGKYEATKLAIALTTEEAFPSSIPAKIPVLGRLFKASESAYNGAALRMRADLMDRMIKVAEKSGIDILSDKAQAESLGKLVNSMTGRGSLGKLEPVANTLNTYMFSPRFVKSNMDFLTAHLLDPKITPYVKSIAAKNLVKTAAGIGSVLLFAKAINDDSVSLDPRSSDFLKIRVGDTRYDITGGMAAMLTLVGRMVTGESKSTKTGKIRELDSDKYGAMTRLDVLYNFLEGKASPAMSLVRDWMKGRDYFGDKPTIKSSAKNIITPLPIKTFKELLDNPDSANTFWSMVLSEVGVGVNTY